MANDDNLIPCLLELGFIKRTGQRFVEIVNWKKDQSWAAGAPARSEKAKRASEATWNAKEDADYFEIPV